MSAKAGNLTSDCQLGQRIAQAYWVLGWQHRIAQRRCEAEVCARTSLGVEDCAWQGPPQIRG
eukprot:2165653-Rhodomonas_salina.2